MLFFCCSAMLFRPSFRSFPFRAGGGTLIRFYYKTAARKKEVPFAKFGKFTINFFEPSKRERCKACERKGNIGPEGPQRAQKAREDEKIHERSGKCAEEHIEPQLAPADAQRERQQHRYEQHAVERVERGGEGGAFGAQQPQGAQQIIEKGERRAQQEGREKALPLHG